MTSTRPALPAAGRSTRSWRFDTRELVLAWCLWLIGVWAVLLFMVGFHGPAHRWMTLAALMGLMGLWPAARLSQDTTDGSGQLQPGSRSVIVADWFCLNLVYQAVLWPMRIVADWSVAQTLWLDVAVAGWSLLTGLLIAWGRSFGTAGMRTLAMLACVAVVVLEPVVLAAAVLLRGPVELDDGTPVSGWALLPNLRLSPVQTVWELTGPPAFFVGPPWTGYALAVAVSAAVGWVVLAVLMPRRGGNGSSEANRTTDANHA